MFDRRSVLLSGAATAALAFAVDPFALAATGGDEPAKLNALFDALMTQNLDRSPVLATSLGLDVGPRAKERGEIDDNSLAGIAENKRINSEQLAQTKTINRTALTGTDQVNYDVVLYGLQTTDDADKRYDYGGGGAGAPYIISQLTGAYSQFPDFLDSQQPVENKADADYYVERLNGVALALDRDTEVAKHDAGLGVSAPDFALDKALSQMNTLRKVAPDKSVMVTSLVMRAKAKGIPGDYQAIATKIVAEKVYPALDRQIALTKDLRAKASHDAGVWRLPKGDQYYADSLISWTTSDMSPADIHKTGLQVVEDYTARIDQVMNANGLKGGSVGERLRKMYDDPKFRYPNTDEGKEKLLADLNKKIQVVRAKLPEYFGILPKADLIIKRVPKFTEAGAPGGYYNSPSLDGKRPGMYYINRRDTAEVPSWTLPTLTYHEGIPGHHLQGSISNETKLPLIRKISFFSAYIEGWALYSEQLADEIGMYADDPWGRIGYMHDAMFRGVRLVVDSGMHEMKWSREKAVKYYTDTLGDQEASAITEVERYCVWPGQACSYMLGKLTILRLRESAKAALGPRFNLKDFHDAILTCGAVPLTVLQTVVDNYI
ncbi:MAG TPA: DUF885 family protein, partial [Rhizomicrobium sp.]|nr:DUF885 family protein [Rhizomicrobium sp.]